MADTAEILATCVLYDEPGRFGAWPSVARTAEGELLVVFSGDRRQHVDPYGKTLLVRSRDDGRTWSAPQVINDSPLDDRDPGIIVLPDGSWLVSLFTSRMFADWPQAVDHYGEAEVAAWQPYIGRLTPKLCAAYLGRFTILSTDRGRSWSGLRPCPVHGPHGPIVAADGTLLYLGTAIHPTGSRVACYHSGDRGESWQLRGELSGTRALPGLYLCEPHLVELPGCRLLGQLRVNAADVEKRQLMQAVSDNGGRSWSPVVSTGIWGLPPHLLRHSSGLLLSSFGHRRAPFGQRVAISRDGGQSWPHVLTLSELDYRERATAKDVGEIYYQVPDLGYPATVELADASLFTVWYQSRPSGEGAIIRGCRWRLSG